MLFTVLIFLLVLSILVVIHECGHFIAAKLNGMKVEEFGFGVKYRGL
jgi:regulator of sigma E protease